MNNQYTKAMEFFSNSIFKQFLLTIVSLFSCVKTAVLLKKKTFLLLSTNPSSSGYLSSSLFFIANFINLLFPCPNISLTSEPIPNWFLPHYSMERALAEVHMTSASLSPADICKSVPHYPFSSH